MSNVSFFVGACSKNDFMIGLGTLLARAGRRVLLVDAMHVPWLKYSNQTWLNKDKWCHWKGMDTVSGIFHWEELVLLGREYEHDLEAYDDILIDTDRITFCEPTRFMEARDRIMVQTVETYAIHRNMEWIQTFRLLHEMDLNREIQFLVLQSLDHDADVSYIMQHMQSIHVNPKDEVICIPYDEVNWSAHLHNEVNGIVDLSKYTKSARHAWRYWVERSCGPLTDRQWRQLLRTNQKGRWWHEAM